MSDWIPRPPDDPHRRFGVTRGRMQAPSYGPSPPDGPSRWMLWTGILTVALVSGLVASILTVGVLVGPAIPAVTPGATRTPGLATTTAPRSPGLAAATPRGSARDPVVDAVRRTGPALVSIGPDAGSPLSGAGVSFSGIIVSSNGLVLTARHLAGGADTLTVELPDGRQTTAHSVASDPEHDLIALRLDRTAGEPASLGSAADLQVGQPVYVLGGPAGDSGVSVTTGVISALGRSIDVPDPGNGQRTITGLLQTDAAINDANAGGALVDAAGRVVGICLIAADSSQGIGFALPIEAARDLIAKASSTGGI